MNAALKLLSKRWLDLILVAIVAFSVFVHFKVPLAPAMISMGVRHGAIDSHEHYLGRLDLPLYLMVHDETQAESQTLTTMITQGDKAQHTDEQIFLEAYKVGLVWQAFVAVGITAVFVVLMIGYLVKRYRSDKRNCNLKVKTLTLGLDQAPRVYTYSKHLGD